MRVLVVTTLVLALAACSSTAPICRLGEGTVPRGSSIDSVEFAVMQRLLLAHDAEGAPQPEMACNGWSTRFATVAGDCAETEPLGERLPYVAPSSDDLVLAPADGDYWIAYLPVHRFGGGATEGPVAIVRIFEDTLEVRAIGVLRTHATRLNLTLELVGEHTVLVADGEACGEDRSSCTRATRLLLLVGRRFEPAHIENEQGACVGPAVFERSDSRVVRMGPRAEQTFRRSLGIDVVNGAVEIAEQIVVEETDPSDPSRPGRVVRRAESLVSLSVDAEHKRFVAAGQSRWTTMLRDAEAQANGTP